MISSFYVILKPSKAERFHIMKLNLTKEQAKYLSTLLLKEANKAELDIMSSANDIPPGSRDRYNKSTHILEQITNKL